MKALNNEPREHAHPTRTATTRRHRGIRCFSLALIMATAISTTAAGNAGAASSNSPNVVRVTGSGVRAASSAGDVPFTFSFDARTPARGEAATGTFSGQYPHDPAFPASGYGYDDNFVSQSNLAGDRFITTVQDSGDGSPDTMGYNDYGDRTYFASQGFSTFDSLCDNPAGDLGTSQFPLLSGDITISG